MRPSTKFENKSGEPSSVSKATLFCPECSFESPVSGEWTRTTDDSMRELRCPVCGITIDRRPRYTQRTVVEAE